METKLRTNNHGLSLIMGFEGYRWHAYRDAGGVLTCGYGHTKGVTKQTRCSVRKAEEWLRADVAEVERDLTKWEGSTRRLTQCQWNAVVSFCFNVGFTKFAQSTLANYIAMNYNARIVRDELEKWCHVKGVVNGGLLQRRRKEGAEYAGEL